MRLEGAKVLITGGTQTKFSPARIMSATALTRRIAAAASTACRRVACRARCTAAASTGTSNTVWSYGQPPYGAAIRPIATSPGSSAGQSHVCRRAHQYTGTHTAARSVGTP